MVRGAWSSCNGVVVHSKYLSICSGVGGLDLAVDLGSSGTAQCVCYVENEVTAAAVLAARMADGALAEAPVWSDLKSFDFSEWLGVDGIIASYPCGPFSQAGERRATDDPRHLWPYIRDGLEAIKSTVSYIFIENVTGHLHLGFREVARDLAALGYRVAAILVQASEVGASHQRERLFILGYADREGRERLSDQRFTGAERWEGPSGHAGYAGSEMGSAGTYAFPPVSPLWPSVPVGLHPSTLKSELHRLDDGMGGWLDLSRTDRIRIAGNGVVPEQGATAWRELWREIADGT